MRSSPLHDYVFRYLPWLVVAGAAGGAWNFFHGVTPTAGQMLAVTTLGVYGAAAAGRTWWRRLQARGPKVLYERPELRRVRDRTN